MADINIKFKKKELNVVVVTKNQNVTAISKENIKIKI